MTVVVAVARAAAEVAAAPTIMAMARVVLESIGDPSCQAGAEVDNMILKTGGTKCSRVQRSLQYQTTWPTVPGALLQSPPQKNTLQPKIMLLILNVWQAWNTMISGRYLPPFSAGIVPLVVNIAHRSDPEDAGCQISVVTLDHLGNKAKAALELNFRNIPRVYSHVKICLPPPPLPTNWKEQGMFEPITDRISVMPQYCIVQLYPLHSPAKTPMFASPCERALH